MLLFAALACMVRPTNAVIWVYLLSNILWSTRHHRRVSLALINDIVSFGCVSLPLVKSYSHLSSIPVALPPFLFCSYVTLSIMEM